MADRPPSFILIFGFKEYLLNWPQVGLGSRTSTWMNVHASRLPVFPLNGKSWEHPRPLASRDPLVAGADVGFPARRPAAFPMTHRWRDRLGPGPFPMKRGRSEDTGKWRPEGGESRRLETTQHRRGPENVVHCPGSALFVSAFPLALRNKCWTVLRLFRIWDIPTAGCSVCWDENSSDLPPFPTIT